jgi:hypothetical protein
MEFSWTILAGVVAANLFWIGVMFTAQQLNRSLPPRRSTIPGTNQRFLYMQDFWTMTWGDFIGVALINTAFVHLAVHGCLGVWHWTIFGISAIVISVLFAKMCMGQEHKPDYGFPRIGSISTAGVLHLPYLGVGVAAGVFCIWFILTGDLRGPVFYVGLGGGAFYALCFVAEIKSGNFDPLKRI